MKKITNDPTLLPLFVTVLAIAGFLIFRPFFTQTASPYALEIASAFIGASLTATITATLLKHQATSELNKEKNVKIYGTKVETYQALMDKIEHVLLEEKLDDTHRFQLQILFQKVVFVGGMAVLEKLPDFTEEFSKAAQDGKISKRERAKILAAFGTLAVEIRMDLNEQEPENKEKLKEIISRISKNFSPLQSEATFLAKRSGEEKTYFDQLFAYFTKEDIDLVMGGVGFSIRNKQNQPVIEMYPYEARKKSQIVAKLMTPEQVDTVDKILKAHAIDSQARSFKAGDIPFESMTQIIAILTQQD